MLYCTVNTASLLCTNHYKIHNFRKMLLLIENVKDVNDIYKVASDKLLLGRKGVCLCKNGKGDDAIKKSWNWVEKKYEIIAWYSFTQH